MRHVDYEQVMLALQAAQQQASAERPPLSGFRLGVGVLLLALSLVALVANVAVLGHFGWSVGQSEIERYVLATAGGLSPILLASLHPIYVMTWRPAHWYTNGRGVPKYRRGRPAIGLLLAITALSLVSLAINFAGGIGVMSTARKTVQLKADGAVDEGQRLKERRASLTKDLAAVPTHRPAGTVEAELDAHKLHRFWKLTDNCAPDKVLNRGHRDYCRDYNKLVSEGRSAEQAGRLQADIAALDGKLLSPQRVEMQAADAQMSAISMITGMSPDLVQVRLALLFPLLLELMVIVPMWAALVAFRVDHRAMQDIPFGSHTERPQPMSRRLPAPSPEPPRPLQVVETVSHGGNGPATANDALPKMFARPSNLVEDPIRQRAVLDEFWSTRIRRADGAMISEPALYAHYQAHAIGRGVREYDLTTFRRLSAKHDSGATEINGVVWHYGVALEG